MKGKILFSLIFGIVLFTSCDKLFNEVAEPVYFKIDSFSLETEYVTQGSSNHDITDAWVYIDDQLQGIYELPAKFPVIASEGIHDILITPGVKLNGIAATRFQYDVMTSYQTNINVSIGDTIQIEPEVRYRDNAQFLWLEDFEQGGESWIKDGLSDSTLTIQSDSLAFEGNSYGEIYLRDDQSRFEIQSNNDFIFPKGGTPVFLELNHKSVLGDNGSNNNLFGIGLISYTVSSVIQSEPFIYLNSKSDWNKTYVNLTAEIAANPNAFAHKIYIGLARDAGNGPVHILIDNLKVVHR